MDNFDKSADNFRGDGYMSKSNQILNIETVN